MRLFKYGLLVGLFIAVVFQSPAQTIADNVISGDQSEKSTISGYIRDASNGEDLIGATIYISEIKVGATTNAYGFYSITVPSGSYNITISYIGYKSINETVDLKLDQKRNFELSSDVMVIGEVVVTGEKIDGNVKDVEISTVKLPMKTIKTLPVLMGEVDVIKTIQLLPGVQSGGEGSTGFHVRGGSMDQNLILLDDAPLYNAAHLMGFFSIFNGDAIKDVKLYKGGIPAEYGGKLSSVLDVRMKNGNSKKFTASGGIGTISSRLTIEGPLIKDKCSFMISGRRTYADVFIPLFARGDTPQDSVLRDSKLYFYDLNTKINYDINENNRLFLSGYFGRDVFGAGDQFGMDYGNATGTVRWNHIFGEKLFLNTTFIYSNYLYNLNMDYGNQTVDWDSYIRDINGKMDFSYFINSNNTLKFGFGSIRHDFEPGDISFTLDTVEMELDFPNNIAYEHAIYAQNEQKLGSKLSVLYGCRLSIFQNVGKATVYNYDKTDPQRYVVTDTVSYKKGEVYNTYKNFEPRLSARYTLTDESSLKASYNRTSQYVHLATNSTSATPLDVWFPSTSNIKPQLADQVAVGYFRNFKNNTYESSIEVYYKKMENAIDFKDHAQLLLNEKMEGELRIGEATSYGTELLLKKQEGKLNGWVSYTLSKTTRKIPEINNGEEYFAPYDKTHDVSIVLSYNLSERVIVSGVWVYSTAAPRTMPTGRFEYGGMIIPVYSDRNSVRVFDYHRLDLSCTIKNKKTKRNGSLKKWESDWNISVYNAYARKNPISITFRRDEDNANETYAEIMYLFSIVPSVTYNFKF